MLVMGLYRPSLLFSLLGIIDTVCYTSMDFGIIEMFYIYKFKTIRKLFLRLTDVLDN